MAERIMEASGVFYEGLLEGWEKDETNKGIPYYVNHSTERTRWDHPLFVKITEDLGDFDAVKYAAYRTSMKLRYLQKSLGLDSVDLKFLVSVCDKHKQSIPHVQPVAVDPMMTCPAIEAFLHSLFNNRNKRQSKNGDTDFSVDLVLNWLLNLYDVHRRGHIRFSAMITALTTLCSAKLSDKYKYYFSIMRDGANQVSRKKMAAFLKDIMKIPNFIDEGTPFGGMNVSAAVNSVFEVAWTGPGLNEDEFLGWLSQDPQTLVWLTTLHRMITSEKVSHDAKCSICKTCPIIGLRYRCLKCFNYDMCQQCFFTGKVTKKHKVRHPTQEYCTTTGAKEDTKAFMRTIRNNLSKKHRNKKKLRYLPVAGADMPYGPADEEAADDAVVSSPGTATPLLLTRAANRLAALQSGTSSRQSSSRLTREDTVDPPPQQQHGFVGEEARRELESVIYHLEDENKHLLSELEHSRYALNAASERSYSSSEGTYSDEAEREGSSEQEEKEKLRAKQEILESHNRQLQHQLERLRKLLAQKPPSVDEAERPPLQTLSQNVPLEQRLNLQPQAILGAPMKRAPPQYKQPPPMYSTPDPHNGLPHLALTHMLPSRSPPSHVVSNHVVPSPDAPGPLVDGDEPYHDSYSFLRSPESDKHVINTSADNTCDTLDPALAETHYSLPSLMQSRNFPDEEAELAELLKKFDKAYPADETKTMLDSPGDLMSQMYQAANDIGTAMSEFVGKKEDDDLSDEDEADDTLSPDPVKRWACDQLVPQHRSFMDSPAGENLVLSAISATEA